MNEDFFLSALMIIAVVIAVYSFAERGDHNFYKEPLFLQTIAMIYMIIGATFIRKQLWSLTNVFTGQNGGEMITYASNYGDRMGIILCVLGIILGLIGLYKKEKEDKQAKEARH